MQDKIINIRMAIIQKHTQHHYSFSTIWIRFWADISSDAWQNPILAWFQKNATWCIPNVFKDLLIHRVSKKRLNFETV